MAGRTPTQAWKILHHTHKIEKARTVYIGMYEPKYNDVKGVWNWYENQLVPQTCAPKEADVVLNGTTLITRKHFRGK